MTEAQAALLSQLVTNWARAGSSVRVGSGVAEALARDECELPTRTDGGVVTQLYGYPVILDDMLYSDEVVLINCVRMRLGTLDAPPRAQPEQPAAKAGTAADWRDTVRQRGSGRQGGGL